MNEDSNTDDNRLLKFVNEYRASQGKPPYEPKPVERLPSGELPLVLSPPVTERVTDPAPKRRRA